MRSYWPNMDSDKMLVLYMHFPFYRGKPSGFQWVDDARHCYGFMGL